MVSPSTSRSLPDFDIVIAGGGLAGWSLLAQLAQTGPPRRRVLVIDDQRAPMAGRTWAYWSCGDGLLDAGRGPSWSQLAIHAGQRQLSLALSRYRYRLMEGSQVVVAATRLAGAHLEVTRSTSTVLAIEDGAAQASVITDSGTITADWVFDSISRTPVRPVLDLSFLGLRLTSDAAVFDPSTVTFLDFRVPQGEGARFVYLLPTSPFQALIEHTSLTPAGRPGPSEAESRRALAEYLANIVGIGDHQIGDYRIEDVESGTLRLGPPAMADDSAATHAGSGPGRVVRIGLSGGLLKPSTGFAFTRIQRHSAAIAASLHDYGGPFHTAPTNRRFAFLDRVFLDAIAEDPGLLATAFGRMFAANPADRILRFLDEDSTPADEARIIASLPAGPFLRAARRVGRHDHR